MTDLFKLSKLSGKYYRDITQSEYEKIKNNCIVFKGTDCPNILLDHILEFKGEAKRVINKTVKYNLYLLADKRSSFDNYVVLNNLPQWRTIVSVIKNGSGIVSSKTSNRYVDQAKKIPQYVHFGCSLLQIKDSLKK